MHKTIAFIPARGGSERVPYKNVNRMFRGHPLQAYCIATARQSGAFSKVVVSSQDVTALEVAHHYGADTLRRPDEYGSSTSPDIEWIKHALAALMRQDEEFDSFAILRVVNPFRTADTIRRAMAQWQMYGEGYDSLRAVELCGQHPGKMWRIINNTLTPLLLQPPHPWHSSQYKTLPKVYVQNASLEIAWTKTVAQFGHQAGETILPFLTTGNEGFDINTMYDWQIAEGMVASGEASLPEIKVPAFT